MNMTFNKASDAISYIQENQLGNVPVILNWDLTKKPKVEVWFGTMEFGRFVIANDDQYEMCVIHDIAEKLWLEEDDDIIEDYMASNGYGGYLIPSQYKGEVVYTEQYVRDNAQ